jgi:hypothetical protein
VRGRGRGRGREREREGKREPSFEYHGCNTGFWEGRRGIGVAERKRKRKRRKRRVLPRNHGGWQRVRLDLLMRCWRDGVPPLRRTRLAHSELVPPEYGLDVGDPGGAL